VNTMETADKKKYIQRRSFFIRLFSIATGMGVLGRLVPSFFREASSLSEDPSVLVKIHPQAVSRTEKNRDSHDK
jgi:hypothetical protein